MRKKGIALEHRVDAAFVCFLIIYIDAVNLDTAACRFFKAGDHAQGCRLSAAR